MAQLFVPKSLLTEKLVFQTPVVLYASENNPGAAAVAAEGTPEFRPSMPTAKQAIPGIPKTVDGTAMPETIAPDFLPKAAVLAGVLPP